MPNLSVPLTYRSSPPNMWQNTTYVCVTWPIPYLCHMAMYLIWVKQLCPMTWFKFLESETCCLCHMTYCVCTPVGTPVGTPKGYLPQIPHFYFAWDKKIAVVWFLNLSCQNSSLSWNRGLGQVDWCYLLSSTCQTFLCHLTYRSSHQTCDSHMSHDPYLCHSYSHTRFRG